MRSSIKFTRLLTVFTSLLILYKVDAQQLDDYHYNNPADIMKNAVQSDFQFNGYTRYWWNDYREWYRYGNLFKISIPDVEKKIVQNKVDIATDLKIPGLWMQEGFLTNCFSVECKMLNDPTIEELENAIIVANVLVLTDPTSETGKKLVEKYSGNDSWRRILKSYQYNDPELIKIDAFMLENKAKRIFVISSKDPVSRLKVKELMENTKRVISEYDMHKGWFGTGTLLKAVTCAPGHPLEIIGKGMNEGNSWFVFSSSYEYLMKDELAGWIARTNMPIVTDVGSSPVYGLDDYEGLQVQDMGTKQAWIDLARKKNGYIFRPVYDDASDAYHYDGYIASEGNKRQLDSENVPFVTPTGSLLGDLIPSMILFIKKGEKLTRQQMWDAIMDRREVAVSDNGVIMGPSTYRIAMQMLLLDRIFLENYYGDRIDLQAEMQGYTLKFTISNTYPYPVTGKAEIQLPEGVVSDENLISTIDLPAQSSKTILVNIRPEAKGMDTPNPIVAGFHWEDKQKFTMCVLDMPPAISVHRILYGHAPVIRYPVSIHNFSKETSYPVVIKVFNKNKSGKPVFTATRNANNPTGTYTEIIFDLKIPAGQYDVEVSALGVTTVNQLGVGKSEGSVYAYEMDLNADGVNEFRLENDSVKITLLSTGARVIEYIVKSRNDNVLFKLWPEKAPNDRRPNRDWGYYPYGGFEDFLGQASMETHKVYDAELIKSKGDYVQVKMTADYYGNKLEKIFTLYGNSPLLEVRFALKFINPEANVIGPQPILEIGRVHGTEDVFTIPTMEGLQEFRMRMEDYYGRALKLKEGWNAGYDTKEDITFVGAFPVSQPYFLHMWMNHPRNTDANHYYVEFQPWTPIFRQSTMYFTYYLWGAGGLWENGVNELRKRNLISVR